MRGFRAMGGQPLFVERGEGPYLYDVDGNRFIDYVLSWGPLITGHAHPNLWMPFNKRRLKAHRMARQVRWRLIWQRASWT